MSAEEYQRHCAVEAVKGSRLPAGRDIPSDEVAALLQVCLEDEKPSGARDSALIALIVGCSLRRSEAAALSVADYDESDGSSRFAGKETKSGLCISPRGRKERLTIG